MILFRSDWLKYPYAIADFQTKNKSFIKMAALLKAMGVKNHTFLLALHDKTLVGVDPFDYANLTHEKIIRIATECRVNPWYFFREVVRVPGAAGDDAIPLEANRGNIALFWYFFNHVTTFLIQIRQTGKSLNSDIIDCYLLNIRCLNTTINLYTKDDALRAVNIQRIKDIFNELPWYLNQRTKKDLDNTEVINVSALGNWYRTHLPQKSPKLALNVARGYTSPIFKSDEGPFCPNARISIPAALASGGNVRDRAKKNNEPYGTIFTTTAGKKDDPDGKFFYQELSCASVHTEHYYDCDDAEDLELNIRNASRTNTRLYRKDNTNRGGFDVNVTLNHKQLGKTDKWLLEKIEDAKVSGDDANRDFFNLWTSGTILSPHSPRDADRMRSSEREPVFIQRYKKQGYNIRWYIPEDKVDEIMARHKFILTADTSEASGGDDIGLSLYLDKTGQTIFSCNINVTNLHVFNEWFGRELIIKYPNITAIIERKSTGVALIDYLLHILPAVDIDPFKRLYNTVVNNKEIHKNAWDEIQLPLARRDKDIYVRYKSHFGFSTSGHGITSRSDLYSVTLSSAVKLVGEVIFDKTTIDQILGLVSKNGRIDHAQGEHDDMVISWLLGHWFMTQAKNLYFYGLNVADLFSSLKYSGQETAEQRYKSQEEQLIKKAIQQTLEELATCNDNYLIERKENLIRKLESQLNEEEREIFSVDELINKAKELRKKRLANMYNYNGFTNNQYIRNSNLDYSDKYSTYNSSFLR